MKHSLTRNAFTLPASVLAASLGVLGIDTTAAHAALLVGNTDSSNILSFDEETGAFKGEFIPAFDGLFSPDDLTFGTDGNLYISYITNLDDFSGAIFRFDGRTGANLGRFDRGGSLKRPYGIAFGPDNNLYVSSFRSDQILRYNGTTGDFLDVFASGNGTANGLNGPNDLLFDQNGDLYVTTQGSVADTSGQISYKFPSQVLRYNIYDRSKTPTVFQEPTPPSDSFVSLLGLSFGIDNDLFVSDFANSIRRYDRLTGKLKAEFSSSYPGFMGNLTFDEKGNLFAPGFDPDNKNIGAISRFDGGTGKLLPAIGQTGSIFTPATASLQRPIGIAYQAEPVPEPGFFLGAAGFGAWLLAKRRKRNPVSNSIDS